MNKHPPSATLRIYRPGLWALATFAIIAGGMHLFATRMLGVSLAANAECVTMWLKTIAAFPALAGILAFVQTWHAHPFFHSDYLAWLRLTPWRPGKPLPQGSLAPPWDHWLFVTLCPAISHAVCPDWSVTTWLLILFPMSYGVGRAAVRLEIYFKVGLPALGFAALALLIAAIYGIRFGLGWSLAAVLLVQPLLWVADREVWRRFPWAKDEEPDPRAEAGSRLSGVWPYNATAPAPPIRELPWGIRVGVTALALWLAFTAAVVSDGNAAVAVFGTCFLGALAHLAVRAGRWHEEPPAGSWRRDVGLLVRYLAGFRGQFLAIVLAVMVALLNVVFELPAVILFPLMTAAVLIPWLFAGPDPETWRLTAPADLFSLPHATKVEEL